MDNAAILHEGPELNNLIATKVMGLFPCEDRFVSWSISGVLNSWDCSHHDNNHYSQDELLKYSTDIAAAWLVVEDLTRRGYYTSIAVGGREIDTDPVWECEFRYYDNPEDETIRFQGRSNTVQLAICRAAQEMINRGYLKSD